MHAPVIRPASTIVLLKDRKGSAGLDVLLMRRSSSSPFMPDAFVYPGGAVEEADDDVCGELLSADVNDPRELVPRRFYVAALRECFEESNLLVATRGTLPSGETRRRWREELVADTVRMPKFLTANDLTLDLSSVVAFDRWITPPFETHRFDAVFFLAQVTEVEQAREDQREVVEATWLSPAEALERHGRGELRLVPPTWMTLSWLTQFDRADDALLAGRKRDLAPIEPYFEKHDGAVVSYLPGHPKHPETRGTTGQGIALHLRGGAWSYRPDAMVYAWRDRFEK